jgi:hypothetical protein
MTIAKCTIGCPWEFDVPGDEFAADEARVRHESLRCPNRVPSTSAASLPARVLGEPVEPVRQLPSVEWRTRALDALVQLAATKATFTVFEIAEYGVGEPPAPRTDWGKLTRDAEHMGFIRHARDNEGRELSARSQRPATKGSLVSVWTAGKAIA